MDVQLIQFLLILSIMIISFTLEVVSMEVTALGALGLLLVFNIITIDDAISGFSNKAVITIGGIFVLSRSLVKTGFLEVFANALGKLGGKNAWITISILFFTISFIGDASKVIVGILRYNASRIVKPNPSNFDGARLRSYCDKKLIYSILEKSSWTNITLLSSN